MKTKKAIFEEIINRFAEAVHYKITRDILLYGVCVLETGNTDDLDEIIEIRKELDDSSQDCGQLYMYYPIEYTHCCPNCGKEYQKYIEG